MSQLDSKFERMQVLATGNAVGTATAVNFASVTCGFANFVADEGNTGVVCIGKASTVTLTTNADSTTAGFQLTAKGQTGFLPCTNLNNFYYICSSTVDHVSYVCVG